MSLHLRGALLRPPVLLAVGVCLMALGVLYVFPAHGLEFDLQATPLCPQGTVAVDPEQLPVAYPTGHLPRVQGEAGLRICLPVDDGVHSL